MINYKNANIAIHECLPSDPLLENKPSRLINILPLYILRKLLILLASKPISINNPLNFSFRVSPKPSRLLAECLFIVFVLMSIVLQFIIKFLLLMYGGICIICIIKQTSHVITLVSPMRYIRDLGLAWVML